MIDLISPTNFDFFARFLLAGLIIISIRSRFVVGERPRLAEMLVEAVILSLINQLAFALIASLLSFLVPNLTIPSRLAFFLEVLALPVLLGSLFGWNLSQGWNQSLLRRLSMPVQNPTRRAYDFAFTQNVTEGFVILTYVDGTVVYGYYGENSLAASDPQRSDIYLERLYDVGADGQWFEKTPSRGALLMLDGIRSIEFLEPERARDE
jgi:Family of unknown function (DUF6338)